MNTSLLRILDPPAGGFRECLLPDTSAHLRVGDFTFVAGNAFGMAHLGAISGLIVMIHHMCGGLGAYVGGALFDAQGHYDTAFAMMLTLSIAAAGFAVALRR